MIPYAPGYASAIAPPPIGAGVATIVHALEVLRDASAGAAVTVDLGASRWHILLAARKGLSADGQKC